MNLLPYFQKAVIPITKLEDYVLDSQHPTGKDKARVFKAFLGIERRHAYAFAEIIRDGLKKAPAQLHQSTGHGDLWTSWHEVSGLNAQSVIVTVAWIFKKDGEQIPSLVSCYIETEKQEKLKELVASRRSDSHGS
jgi:hypothetical protein